MAATRGVVNLTDASKDLWEEDTELMIPKPPRLTGRANKSLSILEQPVGPESNVDEWYPPVVVGVRQYQE